MSFDHPEKARLVKAKKVKLLPVRPFVRGIKNLLNHPWEMEEPETNIPQEKLVLRKSIGTVSLRVEYQHKTIVENSGTGYQRFHEQYNVMLHVNNVPIGLHTKEQVKLVETLRKLYRRLLAKKVHEGKAAKKEVLAKLQEALASSSVSCEPKPPKVGEDSTTTKPPLEN